MGLWADMVDGLQKWLTPAGTWEVSGADQAWAAEAREVIARVAELTGDRRGHLKRGGVVYLCSQKMLDSVRSPRPGWHTAGAAEGGAIWVLAGKPVAQTALAHEAAHLGGRRWFGGPWGGVGDISEAQADAYAALAAGRR